MAKSKDDKKLKQFAYVGQDVMAEKFKLTSIHDFTMMEFDSVTISFKDGFILEHAKDFERLAGLILAVLQDNDTKGKSYVRYVKG